jgi:membrane protein YqaA with SNARE-associated domain
MDFVKPPARHHHAILALVRSLGPLGLFVFAIFDSSPIPTFGALDVFTAILAARGREAWYYYAAAATAGSVIGACITFQMARQAGLDYLHRRFEEKNVSKLTKYFERWGTGALLVCTSVPFPLPTSAFFAIAGVLDYPLRSFVIVVALSRAIRYALIAGVASHYGRRFIIALRHLWQHSALIVAFIVVLAAIATTILIVRRRSKSTNPKTHAA